MLWAPKFTFIVDTNWVVLQSFVIATVHYSVLRRVQFFGGQCLEFLWRLHSCVSGWSPWQPASVCVLVSLFKIWTAPFSPFLLAFGSKLRLRLYCNYILYCAHLAPTSMSEAFFWWLWERKAAFCTARLKNNPCLHLHLNLHPHVMSLLFS